MGHFQNLGRRVELMPQHLDLWASTRGTMGWGRRLDIEMKRKSAIIYEWIRQTQ